MKPLNTLQEAALHALERLGGEADMVELRFQTMFKYTSHALAETLKALKKRGLVTYSISRTKWQRHGIWRLT